MRLLGGEKIKIPHARPDWVVNGIDIVDAKLGQYIGEANKGQFGNFLKWAQKMGGSITYITLTKPPVPVMKDLKAAGDAVGVAVNFIYFPF